MSELAQDTGPPSGTTIAAERIYDIHTTYPLHLTTVRTYRHREEKVDPSWPAGDSSVQPRPLRR